MTHEIVRLRHDTRRRTLTVRSVSHVTPAMLRIVLAGDDIAGFATPAPDDHVKLFVPDGAGGTVGRHYTPRRFDPATGELAIDFALHEAGPVTGWAMEARPGDTLELGGPRGSTLVPADFDWWLLVGDETALPAIARRLEELPAGTRVTSIVAVSDEADRQAFDTACDHHAVWLRRPLERAGDPAPFLAALDAWQLPAGDGFAWIAAEASVARAVRARLEAAGHPTAWLKAAGYWRRGAADVHETM